MANFSGGFLRFEPAEELLGVDQGGVRLVQEQEVDAVATQPSQAPVEAVLSRF